MNYDSTKYRRLGHGDRVQEGDYILLEGGPVPVGAGWHMQLVDGSTEVFLRPIPQEKVAEFATGAIRSDAEGRGRFDLIPYEGLLPLAQRFELGANKFGDNNWLKGQPLSRLLSSMRRHAMQLGNDFSEDHAGAVMWNACAFATMVARVRAGLVPAEVDDIGWMKKEGSQ